MAGFNTASLLVSSLNYYIDQPTISSIFTDRYGFLWVGTQDGVYLFDGTSPRKVVLRSNMNDLIYSNVTGIAESPDNRVIIVTRQGRLLRSDKYRREFLDTEITTPRLNSGSVRLLVSVGNTLFLSTRKGLEIIDVKDSEYSKSKLHNLTKKIEVELVDGRVVDSNNIVLTDGKQLFKINLKTWTYLTSVPVSGGERIQSLDLHSDNNLLIATSNNSLCEYSLNSLKKLECFIPNFPGGTSITDIFKPGESIWIGTNNGLFSLNKLGEITNHFNERNSDLSHNYITKLSGNSEFLWVGTYFGLDHLITRGPLTFNSRNSSIYSDVLCFEEDNQEQLWVGTYNGLYLFDMPSRSHVQQEWTTELHRKRIMTLAKKDEVLWAGLEHDGVYLLNTKKRTTLPFPDERLRNTSVTQILHTRNGETWISSFEDGLFLVRSNGKVEQYNIDPDERVIGIFDTSAGSTLAVTEDHIYLAENSNSTFERLHLHAPKLNSLPTIFTIHETSDARLLFGTKSHGVFYTDFRSLNRGRAELARYSDDPQLQTATVYGFVEDEKSRLWISTNKGVLVGSLEGAIQRRLTKSSGLQGNDFNFGAYLNSKSLGIIFGGVDGYSILDPDILHSSPDVPRVYINNISVPGHTNVQVSARPNEIERVEVPTRYQQLSVEFGMVDFLDPRMNQYRYKLEGYDSDWIDSKNTNSAVYSGLPVGDYTFRVTGANAAGVWNREGASIDISVLPNWWQTRLALYCAALFAVFLIWLMLRGYRTYVLKNRALALADEMSNQAFRAQNELEEQRDFQDEVIKAIHNQNEATLELIRSCASTPDRGQSPTTLAFGKQLDCVAALEDYYHYQSGYLLANLQPFVERVSAQLIQERSEQSTPVFTINRVSESLFPAHVAAPVAIILYELIENALEHAFCTDFAVGYIEISLESTGDDDSGSPCMILRVSDNGAGLPAGLDPLSATTPGFSLIRDLTDSLDAELQWASGEGLWIEITVPQTHGQ